MHAPAEAPPRPDGVFVPPPPDVSHLITEDDTPLDNPFHGQQMRLLVQPLYASWQPPGGRPFIAAANVGVFAVPRNPALVPDMFLSMDVRFPADLHAKPHRAYFLWEYGKPPDVVVEIVSNREGGEGDRKLRDYARMGVSYYAIFDPGRYLQGVDLRLFALHTGRYREVGVDTPLEDMGLRLVLWRGTFEQSEDTWLRWADAATGQIIPLGEERAEAEKARADALEARLRALGESP